MEINFLGAYNGKKIWVAYENIAEIKDREILTKSSILFMNIDPNWSEEQLGAYLELIAKCAPIAFCVCGYKSDFQFDQILKDLGKMNVEKHTMTYHFNSNKFERVLGKYFPSFKLKTIVRFLEEYIYAVIPGDGRWDEWKNYGIIIHDFENSGTAKAVMELIKKKWENKIRDREEPSISSPT